MDRTDYLLGCLYFETKETYTHDEAQNFCDRLKKGSHLIEIFNDKQQETIVEHLKLLGEESPVVPESRCYTRSPI